MAGDVSRARQALQHLGLAYAPDGEPPGDARGRSRYGAGTSAVSLRLDQDLDDLRRRVEALERGRSDPPADVR